MGNVCGSQPEAVDAPTAKQAAPANPATEPAQPAVTEALGSTVKEAPVEKAPEANEPATTSPVAEAAAAKAPVKKLKVFVIFYSTYGHIFKLAETYKSALESLENVDVQLYQVTETLPASVLEKMHAPPKPDVPVIDYTKLPEADAYVFGFPTRFGMMCSQMKNFFDATGMLWQQGALHGKPASLFTSTSTQGGGQETTLMTAVTQLAHHGMIFVPAGYAPGPAVFSNDAARGGSPWGAGTLAGADGARQPSEVELEATRAQAKAFGQIARKLAA